MTRFSALVRTGMLFLILAAPAVAIETAGSRLTLLDRAIEQDQGDWQIDYRLRYDGASRLVVAPETIAARVDGWVSNSRAPGHSRPRRSSLVLSGSGGSLRASSELIASGDDEQRCAERATLSVAVGDAAFESSGTGDGPRPALTIAPGATIRVRLRLEHRHVVYGDYDPLLGARTVEVALGAAGFRDALPLEIEHRRAMPKPAILEPALDRRDTRYFASAPDSLHLEAHVPGNQWYRFPEQPVRYGTMMRLRFSYLIAAGTEGECRARIIQYQDAPNTWKVLSKGQIDVPLAVNGRWARAEHIFRTESDATTLSLQLRIDGAEVGELWVDDVSLTPLDTPVLDP